MILSKKISIIVPVHNTSAEFIDAALSSIIKQTYQNLEIIVVDDGSTDENTIDYLQSIDNSKVKLITQRSAGPGHARNIGLNYATGDYIGFVDSDDWVAENFYEVLLRLCEEFEADMACALLIRKDGEFERALNKLDNNVTADLLKKISYIKNGSTCDKIFRKNLISDIRFDEGVLYEDNTFLIKCLIKSHNVAFTNKTKYFYRVNEKSNVLNKDLALKRRIDKIKVLNKISEITKLTKNEVRDMLLKIFSPILVEQDYLVKNLEYRESVKKILGNNYLKYCNIKLSDKIINSSFYSYFFSIKNFINKFGNFLFSIHNSKDKQSKFIRLFGFEFKI